MTQFENLMPNKGMIHEIEEFCFLKAENGHHFYYFTALETRRGQVHTHGETIPSRMFSCCVKWYKVESDRPLEFCFVSFEDFFLLYFHYM